MIPAPPLPLGAAADDADAAVVVALVAAATDIHGVGQSCFFFVFSSRPRAFYLIVWCVGNRDSILSGVQPEDEWHSKTTLKLRSRKCTVYSKTLRKRRQHFLLQHEN